MFPYQQRVIEEHDDLQEKITKLGNFLSHELFKNLMPREQDLLHAQHDVMEQYAHLLSIRIRSFTDPEEFEEF